MQRISLATSFRECSTAACCGGWGALADACIMADAPNAPVAKGYPLAISGHNNAQQRRSDPQMRVALVGLPGFELQQCEHCKVEPIPCSAEILQQRLCCKSRALNHHLSAQPPSSENQEEQLSDMKCNRGQEEQLAVVGRVHWLMLASWQMHPTHQ